MADDDRNEFFWYQLDDTYGYLGTRISLNIEKNGTLKKMVNKTLFIKLKISGRYITKKYYFSIST